MTDFSISLHQDTCVVDSDDAVVPTAADESSLSDEEVLAGLSRFSYGLVPTISSSIFRTRFVLVIFFYR